MSSPSPMKTVLDIFQLRLPSSSSPAASLPPPEGIAIHPKANRYETVYNPVKMGNAMNIAYGGCAVGVASQAAHQSLAEMGEETAKRFVAYSMLGQYLGPANPSTNFTIFVSPLRATRSFITKTVLVCQLYSNPKDPSSQPVLRPCMSVTVDFTVRTTSPSGIDRSLFTFSSPPSDHGKITPPSSLERWQSVVSSPSSSVPPPVAKAFESLFAPALTLFELRAPPEGALTDNMWGMRKDVASQEGREVWEKRSYDWARVVGDLGARKSEGEARKETGDQGALPIRTEAASASALAFHMDAALSFIPLSLTHRFLDDAGAASSLEFALRIHRDDIDLAGWHLREMRTVAGGNERTYGEARLWDEKGNMVATMTQACVMRPLSEEQEAKRRKKREGKAKL